MHSITPNPVAKADHVVWISKRTAMVMTGRSTGIGPGARGLQR
ncbi:hypothetical protein [Nocardia tengchongensis]